MAREDVTFYGPKGSIVRRALVDTGSTQSMLPAYDAQLIGLVPHRMARVQLADGTRVEFPEAKGGIGTASAPPVEVPIWIGEDGTEPTLGAYSMDKLGYVLARLDEPRGNPEEALMSAASASDVAFGYHSRLSICQSCQNAVQGPAGMACSLCYCKVEKKAREGGCPARKF